MGYTLARQKAYCNAQPMSHETFLLPSSGELGNRFDRAPTSVFPASQIFLVFLFQKSVPSQSLRTCRRLQNRRYFFGVLQASAKRKKKKLRPFYRLPPLQTIDTQRKRQDSEDFELGTASRELFYFKTPAIAINKYRHLTS